MITGHINNVRSMAYRKAPNMAIYEHTPDGLQTNEFFTPITNYQGMVWYFLIPVQ
jgi:hypothetical protein